MTLEYCPLVFNTTLTLDTYMQTPSGLDVFEILFAYVNICMAIYRPDRDKPQILSPLYPYKN